MLLRENPVLIKELKAKMRSRQPRNVQLALGGVICLLIVWGYYQALRYLVVQGGANAGRDGWQAGIAIQTALVWLLCPALAANAISQEKEQQTWEMLVFTRLTPTEILTGKLAARLLPIGGLLVAFLPYMFFCFWQSGLPLADAVLTYLCFVVWSLFLVTMSLFMSWTFRRTATAIAIAYLVMFLLTIGTWLVEQTLSSGRSDTPLTWLSPIRISAALINRAGDQNATGVLVFSLLTFFCTAVLMYGRMITRFRAYSRD